MAVYYVMLSFKALVFGKGKDSQKLLLKLRSVLGLKCRGNKFLNNRELASLCCSSESMGFFGPEFNYL